MTLPNRLLPNQNYWDYWRSCYLAMRAAEDNAILAHNQDVFASEYGLYNGPMGIFEDTKTGDK